MTLVITATPAISAAPAPLRPAVWLSVLVDATIAGVIAIAVERLHVGGFGSPLSVPLWGRNLGILVAAQLMTLALLQAYAMRARLDWLVRVIAGVIAGTAIGAVAITVWEGEVGVPGGFLLIAMLVGVAAVVWRIIWVLAARAQERAQVHAVPDGLVDRAAELMTVGGVVSSLYGYRELLKNLVVKDVKLKYRGSIFGFLWSLANPLLMIIVYATAFTVILKIHTPGFVFRLMLGQLTWTFFASSAAMSTGSVIDNAGLLKSVVFPRAILPIGTVLFNLVQFLLTLVVFLPAMLLWYRVVPAAPMLLFPVFLGLHVVFMIGIALILATATAFFRDVRHLLEVALGVLFWTTPILYDLSQVPARLQPLILLSPSSSFVVAYQQMFVASAWPDASVWLVSSAYALGAFVAGTLMFLTFQERFTEQL